MAVAWSASGPEPRNASTSVTDSHCSYTLMRSDSKGSAERWKSMQPRDRRACSMTLRQASRYGRRSSASTYSFPDTMTIAILSADAFLRSHVDTRSPAAPLDDHRSRDERGEDRRRDEHPDR